MVVVSATNGKTTTAAMLAAMAAGAGLRVSHNLSGANLRSGIITTLMDTTRPVDLVLLEVDEATLPTVVQELQPDVVALGNLFRDQLDRYGELDTVQEAWEAMARSLPSHTQLVAVADDPRVANVAAQAPAAATWAGGGPDLPGSERLPDHADARTCDACGTQLDHAVVWVGHLGAWSCPGCGRTRPVPQVRLAGVSTADIDRQQVTITAGDDELRLELALPGLFNAYNLLLAVAVARSIDIPTSSITSGIHRFRAAFGRFERVALPDGRRLLLVLAKNPTGLSEVARTIAEVPHPPPVVLVALSDGIADGRDPSWTWDADLSPLRPHVSEVIATGTRPEEMALRLAYDGWAREAITVEEDLGSALDELLDRAADPTCVLTYTAMLELRRILRRRGWARSMWEADQPPAAASAPGPGEAP